MPLVPVIQIPTDTTTTTTPKEVEDPNEDKELLGILEEGLSLAWNEARKSIFNFLGPPLIELLSTFPYFS